MIQRKTLIPVLLSALLVACGGPGQEATVPTAEPAEATSADIGEHTVHFSAQSTADLPQDVARAYGISRTKNSAMVTVSILNKGDQKSVPGDISVNAVNLTGQLKNVKMRRIDEQDAIYYIGTTNVDNRETLIFEIDVAPDGVDTSSSLRFKRQFYTD